MRWLQNCPYLRLRIFGCDFVKLRKRTITAVILRQKPFCLSSLSHSKIRNLATEQFCNHLFA